MRFYNFYKTVIGEITLVQENNALCNLYFGSVVPKNAIKNNDDKLLLRAYSEIEEYLAGQRKVFDLPITYNGTPFQNKVWSELQKINYGEVWTYKKLAVSIGNEKACRAVGGANNKNPLPIIIPCHRVIGSNYELVGYAGGLEIKRKLLSLEKVDFR